MHYRLLNTDDYELFHNVRLRACKEEPVAFTEAYEELIVLAPEHSKRYFNNGWIAGAFMDDALVGTAGLYRHKELKVQHKGTVWGVYVAPEARGQGAGRRLIEMVLAEAEKVGLELVHLSTNAANDITVGLYKSLGFESWGIDKYFAKVSGTYIDEVMMVKTLKAFSNE